MYILICGEDTDAAAEALRDYYAGTGITSLIIDYYGTIDSIVESVEYHLPRNITHRHRSDLRRSLIAWGHQIDPGFWVEAVKKDYADSLAHWEAQKLFYFCIVKNLHTESELGFFPGAFKVMLKSSNTGSLNTDESHPMQRGVHDCAVSDIFDLVVDTCKYTPAEMANLIGSVIHDKISSVFKQDAR